MKSLACNSLLVLVLAASASAQSYVYDQPMAANGGTLRHSQLWIDPAGHNDSDLDSIAWEDFQLPQDTQITRLSWRGQVAPPLGFQISFFHQDPGTIAVQPDIFAPGSQPISEEIYTSFTQTSVGGSMYRFDVDLVAPLTFNANTRYFVSVVGRTTLAYVTWDWAASSSGPNGTFWWQRGMHMYFHLPESRAVTLEGHVVTLCTPPTSFCSAKPNSQGCLPAIGHSGSPTQGGTTSFHITATQLLNKKSGLMFYGFAPGSAPFQGGQLCVGLPVSRTVGQNSGGSASGVDCSGSFDFDFEALIQAGTNPNLVAGAMVYTQFWARDPADPAGFGTSLSNGLSFEICP